MNNEETNFSYEDVRILRETLANIHRRAPKQIQIKIETCLKDFATKVYDKCKCEEKSFVPQYQKFVCLNCGHHFSEINEPKLKVVK